MQLPPQLSFSIGRSPSKAEKERNAAWRAKKGKMQKKKQVTAIAVSPTFKLHSPLFILPDWRVDTDILGATRFLGHSVKTAYECFEGYKSIAEKDPFAAIADLPFTRKILGKGWRRKGFFGINASFMNTFQQTLEKNMRVRTALRGLLQRWIAKRMQEVSPVDLVTLDPPKKPVTFWDYKARKKYTFEASTMFKDSKRRILGHDQLFPTPHQPRNPYTNQNLSWVHLYSLHQQLLTHGLAHWTLEALRLSNFCWPGFVHTCGSQLRLAALKSTFQDQKTEDFYELLLDFIESEHENHGATYLETTYRWAVAQRPEDPLIQKWKKLCYRYYHYSIVYADIPQRDAMLHTLVYANTVPLCERPTALVTERLLLLRALRNANRLPAADSA
jgi:hypothetical protein